MARTFSFLRHIRVEEYTSIFVSTLFSLFLLWKFSNNFSFAAFLQGLFYYFWFGNIFFFLLVAFLFLYFLIRFYVILANLVVATVSGTAGQKNLSGLKRNLRETGLFIFSATLSFFRTIIFIFLPFIAVLGILNSASGMLKIDLVDDVLMGIDKQITGVYPFIWLHEIIPLHLRTFLSPIIIYSFHHLFLFAVGGTVFYLFIIQTRKFLSVFLTSLFLSLFFALPLWLIFPAHSPNNMYVANIYTRDFPQEISEALAIYEPDQKTKDFLLYSNKTQKDNPPISTMPSMHIVWAFFVVYFLARLKPKTLIFTLPWFFFSSLGTIYLAQHYFVDALVSIPIVVISILLAELLVGTEKHYFKKDGKSDFRTMLCYDIAAVFRAIKTRLKLSL